MGIPRVSTMIEVEGNKRMHIGMNGSMVCAPNTPLAIAAAQRLRLSHAVQLLHFYFVFLPLTFPVFYLFAIVRSAYAQWWLVIASFYFYAYWDVT